MHSAGRPPWYSFINFSVCSPFSDCRNKLQLNKEDLLEKMKDWEHTNMKLKSDLGVASEQLLINCDELANSKMELQRRRNEINVSAPIQW